MPALPINTSARESSMRKARAWLDCHSFGDPIDVVAIDDRVHIRLGQGTRVSVEWWKNERCVMILDDRGTCMVVGSRAQARELARALYAIARGGE